jgi:hypothetical protein
MLRCGNNTSTCVRNLKLPYGQGGETDRFNEASYENMSVFLQNFLLNFFSLI